MIARLLNFGLRGGGLAGKFLLIFFLARILTPEELGTYGLVTVTLSYALYFLGLDFYIFSGREMAQANRSEWPTILRGQGALYACAYLVVLPLLSILFLTGFLSAEYAVVFYILLVVEHLSQECMRLLIIMGRPLAAGIVLFLRAGAWCYVLVAIYTAGFVIIDLSSVFWAWIIADIFALFFGLWLLRELLNPRLAVSVNWPWIIKGLRVATFFFVGTLALRGIFTFDRYFVELFSGRDILGVYTLYIGITGSIIAFVDGLVFSFLYPRLISIYKSGDLVAFKRECSVFARQTFLAVTILGTVMTIMITPVLDWIGKPIYFQYFFVFYMLLGASVIYVIGHIPHYILYAMGKDRSIVFAHVVGFIFFLVAGLILTPLYGFIGVSFSLLLALIIVGAIKQWKLVACVSSLAK